VNLHLPALPAGVVLQPSSYRLEGVADHDVDVLTHPNPLTCVLDAIRIFMLAGRTSATRVSGLSLRGLNLICRNAAQISNKS